MFEWLINFRRLRDHEGRGWLKRLISRVIFFRRLDECMIYVAIFDETRDLVDSFTITRVEKICTFVLFKFWTTSQIVGNEWVKFLSVTRCFNYCIIVLLFFSVFHFYFFFLQKLYIFSSKRQRLSGGQRSWGFWK